MNINVLLIDINEYSSVWDMALFTLILYSYRGVYKCLALTFLCLENLKGIEVTEDLR